MTAAGLYVHVPFCSSRCSYCDFATGLYQRELAERYVDALVAEIKSLRFEGEHADTIYFGGGTPSLLEPEEIARLVAACRNTFNVAADAEITLEANPESVTTARLQAYREAGVNRALRDPR